MNSKNTIQEELREIAPRLAELQRVNPFRVPVQYFETLPDKLVPKVQADSELSILSSLKKDNAFEVPYNYFENLPGKILNRVREENNKPSFVDSILNKVGFLLKPKYAFASLALIVGIIFFVNRMNTNVVKIPSLAVAEKQVTAEDVNDYISNNIDQFDERSIVACVSNKELDNAPFPMTSIDSLNVDMSQLDDNTIKQIAM